MSDLIGLGVIAVIVLLAIYGLHVLSKPYEVTSEEFEKRVQEGPGLISAGVIGLQKMLEPGANNAIEVHEDLRQGRRRNDDEAGEPPEKLHEP